MAKHLLDSLMDEVDQQKGTINPSGRLEDCSGKWDVALSSKARMHLTIVADGGGETSPDQAAKLAVETIVAECTRSVETAPKKVLADALAAANRTVYETNRGRDYTGVTILGILDEQVFVGQAGPLTRLYLVKPGQKPAIIPTKISQMCLGDSPSQSDFQVEEVTQTIRRGDRFVVCSDGLFSPSDDQSANKEILIKVETEMPEVAQSDDMRLAARHLSSLAKGLDASDDITVAVVGIGKRPHHSSMMLPIVVAGVAVVALAIGLLVALRPQQIPRPPDVGLAVLVAGDASAIDPQTKAQNPVPALSQVGPGTTLLTSTDTTVELKLKRRTDLQSTNTLVIPGINLYVAKQSEISLTTLDLAPLTGDKATAANLINLTEITLIQGQVLLRSDGSRTYMILFTPVQGEQSSQIALSAGQPGVLGVSMAGSSSLEIDCLQGICNYIPANGDAIPLSAPAKTVIDLASTKITTANSAVAEQDWQAWNALCSGSDPGSCDLTHYSR